MMYRRCLVCWLALASLLTSAELCADDAASVAALLERYPKGEIIRIVVSRCGGDITVSQPPGGRVFGRPREDLVTSATIQADMQRCRISMASLEEKARESVDWSAPKGKVYRHTDSTGAANQAAAKKKLQKEKERRNKAEEREQRKAEREAKREAQRKRREALREERSAVMLADRERRDAEFRKRQCEAARERRDEFYERVNETRYSKTRQRYRDSYEKERAWIRKNC